MRTITMAMLSLTFIIGAISVYLSLAIQGDIANAKTGCAESLQKANTGVLVLSTVMVTTTLVMAYSAHACKCNTSTQTGISKTEKVVYSSFILVLSIILTTLGAIIKDNAKKAGHPCSGVASKASTIMGLGIVGILVMVGGGGYIGYEYHKKNSNSSRKSSEA
jgi:hypothetical protein